MEITPFDAATYFGTKPAQPKAKLDTTAFIKLLTVQLANQNPLEPMKDSDFFGQLAQLGTVDGLDKMKGSLDMSQAATMLGKYVTGSQSSPTGAAPFEGTVERISVGSGGQTLTVRAPDGTTVEAKLGSIRSIE